MKRLFLVICAVVTLATAKAQSIQQAIQFNQSLGAGTARSLGLGGAMGALGGDPAVLSINPAGLSVLRKSEFSFTPLFNYRKSESTYLSNKTSDNRFSFAFGNVGILISGYNENRKNWKGLCFAAVYNRDMSYSANNFYEGFNSKNSLLHAWQQKAEGISDSLFSQLGYAFDVGLGYNAYLLNYDTNNVTHYTTVIPYGGVQQSRTQELRGGKGAWSFAFSNNYQDKILLGGSFDVYTLRYNETNTYTEVDKFDSIYDAYNSLDFQSFTLTQDKKTTGTGIGAKFGIIAKPVQWLRIGASFHTPVSYNLEYTDEYSIAANFKNRTEAPEAISSTFNYTYTSPLRATGSLGLVIQQYGLVSVDYEYVDYQATRFNSKTYKFVNENAEISKRMQSTANLRVGAEYKYGIYAFRVGAAMQGSPVKSEYAVNAADFGALTYAAGVGMREAGYYFDIGYGYTKFSDNFIPYQVAEQPTNEVVTDNKLHRIQFTLGFRF